MFQVKPCGKVKGDINAAGIEVEATRDIPVSDWFETVDVSDVRIGYFLDADSTVRVDWYIQTSNDTNRPGQATSIAGANQVSGQGLGTYTQGNTGNLDISGSPTWRHEHASLGADHGARVEHGWCGYDRADRGQCAGDVMGWGSSIGSPLAIDPRTPMGEPTTRMAKPSSTPGRGGGWVISDGYNVYFPLGRKLLGCYEMRDYCLSSGGTWDGVYIRDSSKGVFRCSGKCRRDKKNKNSKGARGTIYNFGANLGLGFSKSELRTLLEGVRCNKSVDGAMDDLYETLEKQGFASCDEATSCGNGEVGDMVCAMPTPECNQCACACVAIDADPLQLPQTKTPW